MTVTVPPIRIARAAAEAARGVPGVVELSSGAVGEFATYGDGGREPGVKVARGAETRLTLRLVVEFGQVLPQLAQNVRDTITAVVSPLLGDVEPVVDLQIVDVRTPALEEPAAIPAVTAPAHDAASSPAAPASVRPVDLPSTAVGAPATAPRSEQE